MLEKLKFWKKKDGFVSLMEIERVLGKKRLKELVKKILTPIDEIEVVEVKLLEEILGKKKTKKF